MIHFLYIHISLIIALQTFTKDRKTLNNFIELCCSFILFDVYFLSNVILGRQGMMCYKLVGMFLDHIKKINHIFKQLICDLYINSKIKSHYSIVSYTKKNIYVYNHRNLIWLTPFWPPITLTVQLFPQSCSHCWISLYYGPNYFFFFMNLPLSPVLLVSAHETSWRKTYRKKWI